MKKCRYVFYNHESGNRFRDLCPELKKACRKAELEDVNWHTFRRTFAMRINKGVADSVTLKELLGHSEVKMTMRYADTEPRGQDAGGPIA